MCIFSSRLLSLILFLSTRLLMASSNPSSSSHGMHRNALPDMPFIMRMQADASALLPFTRLTLCQYSLYPVLLGLITCRKMSDGMFLSACREVSKDYPDVAYDEDLLDRVCLQVTQLSWLSPGPTNRSRFRLSPTPGRILTVSWLCPTCMVTFCRICALVSLVVLGLHLPAISVELACPTRVLPLLSYLRP